MIKNKNKYFLILVMAALTTVSLFVSCSKATQSASFATNLQIIDGYINDGSVKEALKLLKKTQKNAYSPYERIGIYNRYMLLGESVEAEKVLKKAIRKLPDNIELKAVYTHFLLRQQRTEDAFKLSKVLVDTQYGSLYSEAVLRLAIEKQKTADEIFESIKIKETRKNAEELEEKRNNVFFDERFVPVYLSAYTASHNPVYQIDAACLYLIKGNYEKASAFYDGTNYSPLQCLFWGLSLFDAGYYSRSLESLLQSEKLGLSDDVMMAKILMLEADDFHVLGDDRSSRQIRQDIISIAKESEDINKGNIPLPLIYMNESCYSTANDDMITRYDSLLELVSLYPEYDTALAGLASYAIDYQNLPKEDDLSADLRSSGLKTLEMEKADRIPKLTLSDVTERINDSLNLKDMTYEDDELLKNKSYLIVLKQRLYDLVNREQSQSQKVAGIWKMIDENFNGNPDLSADVVRYAVVNLIRQNYIEDAKMLFDAYIASSYGSLEDAELSLWEREVHAWFCVMEGNPNEGLEIYQDITNRYGNMNPKMISREQLQSVINSEVNLGVIYSSLGMDNQSREMFSKASALCVEPIEKAEILYRLAAVDYSLGNSKNAVRELQYALTMDKGLNKARLMLKKLHADE